MECSLMQTKFIAIILLMSILLAAYSGKSASEELDSKDVKELVQNYSVGKITDQTASITSTQLIVTDSSDNESVYDLPEEEFFVYIAPFINETHHCEYNSLTGCQEEMVDKDFDVYNEDMDGNILLDDTLNSEIYGIIHLWILLYQK